MLVLVFVSLEKNKLIKKFLKKNHIMVVEALMGMFNETLDVYKPVSQLVSIVIHVLFFL